MVEGIVISILFIGAVVYLLGMLRKNFRAKEEGCAKGCGSCTSAAAKPGNKTNSLPLPKHFTNP